MLHQQSPTQTSLPTTVRDELKTVGVNVLTERLSSTGKYHEIVISDTIEARKVFMRTVKKTFVANAVEQEYDTLKKRTFHCKRQIIKIGDELKEFFGTRTVLIPFAIPV
jgi:hypothetical protein